MTDIIRSMLTKSDLKEIGKLLNSQEKRILNHVDKKIDDKIDTLAIAVKKQFDVIELDVKELKTDVAVLKTDVVILKADLTVLKTDVSVLKTDVAVLKSDMKEVKKDTKGINRIQMSHETRLVNLEA